MEKAENMPVLLGWRVHAEGKRTSTEKTLENEDERHASPHPTPKPLPLSVENKNQSRVGDGVLFLTKG